VHGERRSFALLRPIVDANAQNLVRDLILLAYAEQEAGAWVIGAAGVPRWRFGGARAASRTSVGPLPRSERVAIERSRPCQKCVVTTLDHTRRSPSEAVYRQSLKKALQLPFFQRLAAPGQLSSCEVERGRVPGFTLALVIRG
jgi:hypothetical protein